MVSHPGLLCVQEAGAAPLRSILTGSPSSPGPEMPHSAAPAAPRPAPLRPRDRFLWVFRTDSGGQEGPPPSRYLSCTTSSQLSTTVRPDTVAIVACTVDTSLQTADGNRIRANRVRAHPSGPPAPPHPAPVPSAEQDAVLEAPSRGGPTESPHAEREQPREEGGRDSQRPPHGARAASTARRGTTAPGGGSPAPASPAPRRQATPL